MPHRLLTDTYINKLKKHAVKEALNRIIMILLV